MNLNSNALRYFLAGACIVLALAGSYLLGRATGRKEVRTEIPKPGSVIVDTSFVIHIDKPVIPAPASLKPLPPVRESLPLSGAPGDSVEVDVPIEKVTYTGEGWAAVVSGHNASLDSLAISWREVTVTRTVRPSLNLNAFASVEVLPPIAAGAAGLSATYAAGPRLSLESRVGVASVWNSGGFAVAPYVSVGVHFTIAER